MFDEFGLGKIILFLTGRAGLGHPHGRGQSTFRYKPDSETPENGISPHARLSGHLLLRG